jgi:hypothetical protein
LFGALIHTGGAAIAGYEINVVLTILNLNGIKAADLSAETAALALVRVYHGLCAADKFVLFEQARMQYQFEIGGVDIGIGQNCTQRRWAVAQRGQMGKRCRNARLARPPAACQVSLVPRSVAIPGDML